MELNCKHAMECQLASFKSNSGDRKIIQVRCDLHKQTDETTGEFLGTYYWTDLSACKGCKMCEPSRSES